METPNCETCGTIMKLIPAGISKKTGKPYQSFFACPTGCKKPTKQDAGNQMILDEFAKVNARLDKLIAYVVKNLPEL